MAKGDHALDGAVEHGQDAELHQQLEAVADAEHELAVGQELPEMVEQGGAFGVPEVAPAHAGGLGRAEIVAVEEASGEDQEVVVVKTRLGGGDVGEVHDVGLVRAGLAGGVGGFDVRIGAVAGDDERVDSAHAEHSFEERKWSATLHGGHGGVNASHSGREGL